MSFNDGFNIRSVPWPSNTPVSGNSLVYNGSQWIAANVSGSGGGGTGDITAVNAGTNLTGGGDTGDVTISLSSSVTGLTNLQTTTLTASYVTGTSLRTDYIDFNTNLVEPSFQTGRLHFDPATSDLIYDTDITGVTANYGQQIIVKVKNNSLSTINKGKLVRINGGLGNNPTVTTASWENDENSANTLGMMMNTAAHNGFAYVLLEGILIGVNTNTFSAGDSIYLSSSGDYTNITPVVPRHTVRLGEVVRVGNSSVGVVFIKVQNGFELSELHNVSASVPLSSDLLVYDSANSYWKNSKSLSGSFTIIGNLTASNISGSTARFTTITASNLGVAGTMNASGLRITGSIDIFGSAINAINVRDFTDTANIFNYNTSLEQLTLASSVSPTSILTADPTFLNISDSGYIAQMAVVNGSEVKLDFYVSASSGIIPSIIVKESDTLNPVSLKLDAANVDVNNTKIINLLDPDDGTDAANKQYVDNAVSSSEIVRTTSGIANDRVLIGSGSNSVTATSELTFYDNGPSGYKSLRIADPTDSSALFVDHTAIDNTGGNLDIAVSNASSLYIGHTGIPVTINGNVAIDYTPSTPNDWNGTAPTTVAEALDRIAALLKALNSGTGP